MIITTISGLPNRMRRLRESIQKPIIEEDFEHLLGPTIDQTLAELRMLTLQHLKEEDPVLQKLANEYREEIENRPKSWQEVFQLELLTIKLLPDALLLAKLPIVSAKYKLAGFPEIKLPEDVHIDSTNKARTLVLAMTAELQWNFRKSTLIQRSAKQLRSTVSWRVMRYALILSVASLMIKTPCIVLISAIMGLLGSYVSILRRMMQSSTTPPSLNNHNISYRDFTEFEDGKNTVYLALLSGPIFGFIAMLLLIGKLLGSIGGDLMPDFTKAHHLLAVDFRDYDIEDIFQITKIMAWCFLAGFAEQLIPDVLDKLAGKKEQKN